MDGDGGLLVAGIVDVVHGSRDEASAVAPECHAPRTCLLPPLVLNLHPLQPENKFTPI